jgi:hypothetical protein
MSRFIDENKLRSRNLPCQELMGSRCRSTMNSGGLWAEQYRFDVWTAENDLPQGLGNSLDPRFQVVPG